MKVCTKVNNLKEDVVAFQWITFLSHHFNKGDKKIIWTIDFFSSNLQNNVSHGRDFSYFSAVCPAPHPPGSDFEMFIIEQK